jgi:hypothetical protein
MNEKSRTSRAAVAVLAALMAIVLIGCSDSGPSTTGPSAVAPGSASMVVLSQTIEEVEPGGQRIIDFSLPHRGTLALTVRWNDPLNTVIAVLTSTGCRDFRSAGADCPGRRSIEHEGREGREQVIADPDAAGGYQLLVENEGPGVESIRVSAELTTVSVAPPSPTPQPTAPPERRSPTPRRSWEP